jgi:hypothetical protein
MKKFLIVAILFSVIIGFGILACNNKNNSPASPFAPIPPPQIATLQGVTDSNGVVGFNDTYLNQTIQITSRDISSNNTLAGINVSYIDTYTNIIVVVSDPNKKYSSNIKIIPITTVTGSTVNNIHSKGVFKLAFDVFMGGFDTGNILYAYAMGDQALPSFTLRHDGNVPMVCASGSFNQLWTLLNEADDIIGIIADIPDATYDPLNPGDLLSIGKDLAIGNGEAQCKTFISQYVDVTKSFTICYSPLIKGYFEIVKPSVAGTNWFEATGNASFSGRADQSSVTFGNKMWVIGGENNSGVFLNDVWSSTDGINWNQATSSASFSGRESQSSLTFNNAMWVIGGTNGSALNDVWSSTDGITWNQATASAAFSPRYGFPSVVFNNAMWVIGGLGGSPTNDVWSSTDGINWNRATASAAFSARVGQCVVYNNAMWVIGGTNGASTYYNDVWSSTDGITWNQATASAAFSPRFSFSSVVYNNAMWVIAGSAGSEGADVWSSTDGINWNRATSSAAFSQIASQSSLVYNNAMWVIAGGWGSVGNYVNNVWYSP